MRGRRAVTHSALASLPTRPLSHASPALPAPLPSTGKVVAILTESDKRSQVVGVLQCGEPPAAGGPPALFLLPLDPKLPRCVVRTAEAQALAPELLQEADAAGVGTRWASGRAAQAGRVAAAKRRRCFYCVCGWMSRSSVCIVVHVQCLNAFM